MLVSRGFLDLRRMASKYESGGVVHALLWQADRDMKLLRNSTPSRQSPATESSEDATSGDVSLQADSTCNVRKLRSSSSAVLAQSDD